MEVLSFRRATILDAEVYFKWLNDYEVREHSFNSNIIIWDEHYNWFKEKILDPNYAFYLFQNNNGQNIGQVRFNKTDILNSIIGVSIGAEFRGKGYGSKILKIACFDYLKSNPNSIINAYIKFGNITSKAIFEKAGFQLLGNESYKNFLCHQYVFYENR